MKKQIFTVLYKQEGLRIFEVIASELNISKKKAMAALDAKQVLVNGRRVWMKNHLVKEDDNIEILIEEKAPFVPKKISILWQDSDY